MLDSDSFPKPFRASRSQITESINTRQSLQRGRQRPMHAKNMPHSFSVHPLSNKKAPAVGGARSAAQSLSEATCFLHSVFSVCRNACPFKLGSESSPLAADLCVAVVCLMPT